MTTSLLTDHYELTALEAALQSGVGARRSVFEVFARGLPTGRRYGVVAGTARVLAAIDAFRFDPEVVAWLSDRAIVGRNTLDWLAAYRFSGNVDGYREGELYFPHSPVLTVEATFAEALILETVILSILNHDSAIASAAARMVDAAAGRGLIEGGGRRTHELAAVDCARAAYLAGFDVTSNLEAGRRYGIPTAGTTMHAFTLAHCDERAAFDAQIRTFGAGTTFLVDTFDIEAGVEAAVAACGAVGRAPGAIRIDSGDLAEEARRARVQLDRLGAETTRIVVSGDLDEHSIANLADAPVDRYLVGTRLVTGSGAPTAGMVYKLVAIADGDDSLVLRPVEKRSKAKVSIGGRKVATRLLDDEGYAYDEHVVVRAVPPRFGGDGPYGRELQVPLVRGGETVSQTSLADARAHCAQARSELRPMHRDLTPGVAALDGAPGR